MEILSTGEKIKRARVYKGYTLKDICSDKLSVSKMSCIENGKIYPEDWVLDLISDKLGVTFNYLKQDVSEQIIINLSLYKKNHGAFTDEEILYNIKTSELHGEYPLAFAFASLLFQSYLNSEKLSKAKDILPLYYEIFQRGFSLKHQVIFLLNQGKFLILSKEYMQAIGYFNSILEINYIEDEYIYLVRAMYYITCAYMELEEREKAYKTGIRLLEYMDGIKDDLIKGKIYKLLALISINSNINMFFDWEKKSEVLFKEDKLNIALSRLSYGKEFLKIGSKVQGISFLNSSKDVFPKANIREYVEFIFEFVSYNIEYDLNIYLDEVLEESLNFAINLNDNTLVEKAYHFKALLSQRNGDLSTAELFMNFSLDALLKVGNTNELYKRYMEMGNMYYNFGNTVEAIKYLSLALSLSKKL
ncbi:MAG TPA: helix-turn-helix transcriptional regulator [Clostridiaceae bacterium]